MPFCNFEGSAARIRAASQYLPGGVNSNFRLGISPTPLVFERADGAFLFDTDGNRLIDYYLGMGPMILGHRPSAVVAAARAQLEHGLLYGGQSELEFEAAERVCAMVPCAERVRFGSSGTEMVQAALRLARAATRRDIILKFEGHYHGWLDNILWSVAPPPDEMGAESRPVALRGSQGQDALCGQNLEVLVWNDADVVRRRLAKGDVAAVIMEPAMCNAGAIFPAPGYLQEVRGACDRSGTLLIFDEVITGFRVSRGGAQEHFGVTPDLAVFGKALASGFPVACLAGRASLMDMFVKQGVMHGGTYNAQAVSMAATVATLDALQAEGFHARLAARGQRLMDGIARALRAANVTAVVSGFPQIFHVAMGLDTPPRSYRDIVRIDRQRYVKLTTALLRRGVRALERGAWFLSIEHSEDVIEQTLDAFQDALSEI